MFDPLILWYPRAVVRWPIQRHHVRRRSGQFAFPLFNRWGFPTTKAARVPSVNATPFDRG